MRKSLVLLVVLLALLASCENFFTNSPLGFLRRDPANMTEEQKRQYAQDVLASGDTAAMQEAYDALKSSTDPDTQLLAADLAVGAVGLESALTGALSDLASGADPQSTIDAVIGDFNADDFSQLAEAAALVDQADASVTPTPEQYLFAAVSLMAVAADQNGGATGLDTSADPEVQNTVAEAEAFLTAAFDGLQASGESTELLDSLGAAIGWTAP